MKAQTNGDIKPTMTMLTDPLPTTEIEIYPRVGREDIKFVVMNQEGISDESLDKILKILDDDFKQRGPPCPKIRNEQLKKEFIKEETDKGENIW